MVDDDPAIRNLIGDILELSAYFVKKAANGAEALDQIRIEPPAAIFLDLTMPIMGGQEFLRLCRRERPCALVPVVLMSAAPDVVNAGSEVGAQAFLSKPFELETVLALVAHLVTGASRGVRGARCTDKELPVWARAEFDQRSTRYAPVDQVEGIDLAHAAHAIDRGLSAFEHLTRHIP